ncbi:MAG: hypothetical protein ABI353_10625 [Isosphaeraceae bacterium]
MIGHWTRGAMASGLGLAATLLLVVAGCGGQGEQVDEAVVETDAGGGGGGVASAPGAVGTIKGRVIWGSADIPAPKPLDNKSKDPEVCGKAQLFSRNLVVDPETKGVMDLFAYIPKATAKNDAAVKALVKEMPEVEIDQKNCEYQPFATVMHKDQKLLFKSGDPVMHNVHYSGLENNRNFAVAPNTSVTQSMVKELNPVPLKCDVHPWMSGWIMVFDHPYFALTKADGSFEIKDVPAGTQNLVIRSGKMGYVTKGAAKGMPVTVEADKTTDLGDITFEPAAGKARK